VSAAAGIRKLLVANRGEIALRVFRTCRELGIETVAVVAPDDRGSLHARSADETAEVASYLEPAEHVRAALATGADAVHPGYGFLSESPQFAAAVEEAGLTWVGPPVEALAAGGDKLASKRIAEAAGVPVVRAGDPEEIGYPLLVKAAAGGGGRGMRVVRAPDELEDALDAARREAKAAFGDETVFCERYVERPRHVEIQLLADSHGTVLALGERDCSIQRRHQKVLEESPSPGLDPTLRARMSTAAVSFAREIGYVGAGTAEFMVAGDEFFFLELNARIQVEHPVTEAVTGIDLVAQQIRVAGGERLQLDRVRPQGHAVEVRVYAEHPHTFLPQTGRIERLRLPPSVRVDAGVAEGDEVGTRYDPMIAKLIAHGATREDALARLHEALAATEIRGVTTNLPFLRWLIRHPVVGAGETTTAFLDEHPPLSDPPSRATPAVWRAPFRLNLAAPRPAPSPDVDDVQHREGAGSGAAVVAPMPGTVLRVHVEPGQRVSARQPLVVIEAMKMETSLTAPHDATVSAVHVSEGQSVAGGTVLVEFDEASSLEPAEQAA
jgi:acetyl/propionyl-CoA carboxylase alpha subunit